MKCQILFSGKNKKKSSICHLLNLPHRVVKIKGIGFHNVGSAQWINTSIL